MRSKLIAHVVFNVCGAVDDACYSHENDSRAYFCVNAPYFDSTSCFGDSCYTNFFDACEVLANRGRSCDETNDVRCIAIISLVSNNPG